MAAVSGEIIDKYNPASGVRLWGVARSRAEDVATAVAAARRTQPDWASVPPVQRGLILHRVVEGLTAARDEVARIVSLETGKSPREALGETDGAIQCGLFFAGEGQRLYGRTCTSGVPDKYALTVRQPVGVAGLIVAANTPIANVAWKVFPALICGNAAVLKSAEDTPATAWVFAEIAREAGLPAGVLNVVQGLGQEAGAALVAHPEVDLISFTGSTAVGRVIAETAGRRLAKVSLELGGKNPLVVADDADLDRAVRWAILSAFSNAGQRCAAASRIVLFDAIYEDFRDKMIAATAALKVGPTDDDDFGPVINPRQLENMTRTIDRAVAEGAVVLAGGHRLTGPEHGEGYYLAPTIIEGADPRAEISLTELFGPIVCIYRVRDFEAALALADDSPYGLTACIHTANFHRAVEFCRRVQTGVAVVNAGTYGSEPHMPFGGLKQSGNGTREPGTEALDVYSETKDIYLNVDPTAV
jgi:aldehyde dehydrogenase (NAD+)